MKRVTSLVAVVALFTACPPPVEPPPASEEDAGPVSTVGDGGTQQTGGDGGGDGGLAVADAGQGGADGAVPWDGGPAVGDGGAGGADAGHAGPDGGAGGLDAGTAETDASHVGDDAGPGAVDAGLGAEDAGTGGADAGVDPCQADWCHGHGDCTWDGTTATCLCQPGFRPPRCDGCDEGFQDNDHDDTCFPDCSTAGLACPGHARCDDLSGTASCLCPEGWRVPGCDACASGWHLEGESCVVDTACLPTTCNQHGQCDDTSGTPVCTCDEGYAPGHCDTCAPTHQDKDGDGVCLPNCATANLSCSTHGRCDDDTGTPLCACDPGYRGPTCRQCAPGFQDNDGDGLCLPDCSLAVVDCGAHGACQDLGGVARCACVPGWAGPTCAGCAPGFHDDAGGCVPDTTCSDTTCSGRGSCDDTTGTPVCTCDEGHAPHHCDTCLSTHQDNDGDGACEPTCATSGLDCGPHGRCTDLSGAAACVCDEGYDLPACLTCAGGYQDNDADGTCTPDCDLSGLACGHGVCSDLTGRAACVCDEGWRSPTCTTCGPGFHPDGEGCAADTTCAPDTCNTHGDCDDSSGAPRCTCTGPYTGNHCERCQDGYQDNDFDGTCAEDCASALPDCGVHGACSDLSGSAGCACHAGYTGPTCRDCAPTFQDNDGDGTCALDCDHAGLDCGDHGHCDDDTGTARCSCDAGHAPPLCRTCVEGYQDKDRDGACEPTCATAGLDCGSHGECTDGSGTATCACDAGYALPRCVTCESGFQDNDHDGTCALDCDHAGLDCGSHGLCDDGPGASLCACDVGWSGTHCEIENLRPVAVVAPEGPVTVREGVVVTLDGSGSSDVDGTIMVHAWTLPVGYTADMLGLDPAALAGPVLTPTTPEVTGDTALVFTLTVTDDDGATDSVAVVVNVVDNLAPVAVVTPPDPRAVRFGRPFTLDGSGSTDDGVIAAFLWALPAGYSAVDLGLDPASLLAPSITFTAPLVALDTLLTFVLTLTDDQGLSVAHDVEVTVLANRPPVAVVDPAGPLPLGRNRRVQLNGSGSHDADGTVTAYAWTLPPGFTPAQLGLDPGDLGDAGITPTTPGTLGPLTFTLTVTDNDGATGLTTVVLDVVNNAPVLECNGSRELAQTFQVKRAGPPDWFRVTLDFSRSTDPEGDPLTYLFQGPLSGATNCAPDFGFHTTATGAQFQVPLSPTTPACQGSGPFTLTVVGNDGLADSPVMVLTFFVQNGAPAVNVTGPAVLEAGLPGQVVANATDPDVGDTLTYAWRVHAASDPAVDCAGAWVAGPGGAAALDITSPVDPVMPPACGTEVVFYVDVTDNHGAVTTGGWVVRRTGAGPVTRTLTVNVGDVPQGATYSYFSAVLSPAGGSTDTVTWSWTVSVVSGSCVPADIVLTTPWADTKSSSYRTARAGVGRSGCVFLAEATATVNGTPLTATNTFSITNRPPTAVMAPAIPTAPGHYETVLPPGLSPVITATTSDPDGWEPDLTYTWGGAALPLVTCQPACSGTRPTAAQSTTSITFQAPPPAGSVHDFTLRVADGDDDTTILLTVRIEPCLYVGTAVVDPSAERGTRAHPYLVIQEALDAAVTRPDTNVCLFAGTYAQDVMVPHSTDNTPSLSGGYSLLTGQPLTTGRESASVIQVQGPAGLTFAPGATNTVEYVVINQAPSLFAPAESAAVTVEDGSPFFFRVSVTGGAGNPAVGLSVVANTREARPRLLACTFTGSDRPLATDAAALRVREVAGEAEPVLQGSTIRLGQGTGVGVGVEVTAGGAAVLRSVTFQDDTVNSFFSVAAGVYAHGDASNPATFTMEDSNLAFWRLPAAEDVFGVRLAHTSGVRIQRSGIQGNAGLRAGFGVADGNVFVDGTVEPGSSQDLMILDNTEITGMGPWAFQSGCVGTRFANGVLLVGTRRALLQGNRSPSPEWHGGLRGGRALYNHDWATQRLPPSVAGVWLVDAAGVEVVDSDVVNGSLSGNDLCSKPVPYPVTTALVDGVVGSLGHPPGSATDRLVVDRSAVYCSVSPENGAAMMSFTWCVAADLQGSRGATVTNSVMASLSANVNVALRMSGGTSADVVNNLLDPDFIRMGMPPPANSVYKYGILADHVGPGALRVFNNIVVVRRDDPYDRPSERLALREVTESGTDSRLAAFSNNLLYIEGDDLGSTGSPPYVRVLEGAGPGVVEYAADGVNAVAGIPVNGDNLVDLPGLREPSQASNKKAIRLDPGSVAVGKALAAVAPGHDVDNQARTAPVDIGHDEVSP